MLRTNLFVSAMLVASFASAQIAQPDVAVPAPGSPALISSLAIQSGDSPLVQAAKRSVAARQRTLTVKIDNTRVRSSTKTLSTSSGGTTVATFNTQPTDGSRQQPRSQSYPGQATSQQNVQQLQNNLRQAVHEEEQGPYSDGMEDLSQQRINTIPGQLQKPPQ